MTDMNAALVAMNDMRKIGWEFSIVSWQYPNTAWTCTLYTAYAGPLSYYSDMCLPSACATTLADAVTQAIAAAEAKCPNPNADRAEWLKKRGWVKGEHGWQKETPSKEAKE